MTDNSTETETSTTDIIPQAEPHPWVSTPEAAEAARKAVQVPLSLTPALADSIARDELETRALGILAECALPPRDQLTNVVALRAHGHIGSMWSWPEDDRAKYAVREIGYALMNWLRTKP